ncbi:MAG: alpha/beta hydrolase [Gordonia sp. (in: high G+C Gram-positive bacteria)]
MTDFHVPSDLGRLHVHLEGAGPPVVLWHSMFVDSRSWGRLIPLIAAGRTVAVVDAPSSGLSDPLSSASDIAGCAEAAVAVVDEVRRRAGADSVDWLGNAWGGHVGIVLAADRPDLISSLVAISAPTYPIGPELRRKIRLLLPLYRLIGARGPVLSAIEETLLTDAVRARDAGAVALLRDSLASSGKAMIPAIETAILNRTDLSEAARTIAAPVLFVVTDDRGEWTPDEAAAMAVTMPDARVATVHASRVIPALEQPAATAAAILAFWSEAGAAS